MKITIDKLIDKHYDWKKYKPRVDHYMDLFSLVVCNYCELVKHVNETDLEDDLCVCNECYNTSHADES